MSGLPLILSNCCYASPVATAPGSKAFPTNSIGATLHLSEKSHALLPVVVGAQASERVKGAATTLADYLSRISDARFKVQVGDGTSGIIVGTANDFPTLAKQTLFGSKDATQREDYLLRSQASGLYLLGNTDLAVEHAVWDVLYRLGYRQFFLGKDWEVVPHQPDLSLAIDVKEHPAYNSRSIWYGFGNWDGPPDEEDWNARNRATSGIILKSGHSYDTIYSACKAEFDAHPEYICSRKPLKFCISNPGLRRLVVQYALDYFAKNPDADSISMEPSDGGGWECQECADNKEFKSVTDRVVTLANEVAEAVNKQYNQKYVGIYAYNEHSPPPSIQVNPHVVVSVATAFTKGNYTLEQLLAGWHKQGANLGIREYYSVNPWDRDMPGAARAGNISYLQKTIPEFAGRGARFMSAESSDNWGPNGLGYYIAARLMWNPTEASKVGEIKADFLEKAFGSARQPMGEFYDMLDGSQRVVVSDDLIGRMYQALDHAQKASNDPGVQARIADLALYTHYVELYHDYSATTGAAHQSAFETLIKFSYRIRATHMAHSLGLYRDLAKRDKSVVIPPAAAFDVDEPKNPWKSSVPFEPTQIAQFISEGITHHPLLDFRSVVYSADLVPATALKLSTTPSGSISRLRGTANFYAWVDKAGTPLELKATSGLAYADRGGATFDLYAAAEALPDAVATATIAPDKTQHPVALSSRYAGLHRIRLSDGRVGTLLDWPQGEPVVLEMSPTSPVNLSGRWSLYFYVPKGTKVVGGHAHGSGQLLAGDGQVAKTFTAPFDDYFSIPVPTGQDGKLWHFANVSGDFQLMTVPPYLARSAAEMLVPREVVVADSHQ